MLAQDTKVESYYTSYCRGYSMVELRGLQQGYYYYETPSNALVPPTYRCEPRTGTPLGPAGLERC